MDMGNNAWSLLSIVLYLASFFFFFKSCSRGFIGNIIATFVVISSFVFSLLTGAYLVANWFTGIGFDESIFYHLNAGVGGADFSDFYFLIILFVLLQLLFLFITVFYLRKRKHVGVNKNSWLSVGKGVVVVFCAYFCTPATSNLLTYIFTSQVADDFSEYFVQPKTTVTVAKPKNIIYFYLESLERNYMDEKLFPGLLPELHKIEKESVSFTEVGQTVGGNWTMAGMVSSQCGLPLLSVFTNENFHMNAFMPNAVCLGDILKSNGYHLEFMGGAEMEFAGKGLFYQDHGFTAVKGKEELLKDIPDAKYINNWGLYDDTLYDKILQRVKELRQTNTPWGIFSINIGTHQPEGFLSHSCTNIKYGDGSDNLLNAAQCTDYLLGKIYKALKDEGVLDDTLIVFASDHFAPVMVKPYAKLNSQERHNLLLMTGSGLAPVQNSRHGTTLDVAPTVLNYMNFGSHPVGIGRDLNAKLPTFAESYPNVKSRDVKIFSWRTVIDMAFWGYPEMQKTVVIDSDNKKIKIGEKTIDFPSLIRYGASGKIEDISYKGNNPVLAGDNRFMSAYYLVNLTSNNDMFLWVDSCRTLATLNPELPRLDDKYCFYNGTLASMKPSSGLISQKDMKLDINMDAEKDFSATIANERRELLKDKNLIKWGAVLLKSEKTSSFPFVGIMSAGSKAVMNSAASNVRVSEPGLTLTRLVYEINADSGVRFYSQIIEKLPVCDKSATPLQIAKLIKNAPLDNKYQPLFYSIVGNVEDKCQAGFVNAPGDILLKKLTSLKVGSPYVVILDNQLNVKYEAASDPDKMIGVRVASSEEQL